METMCDTLISSISCTPTINVTLKSLEVPAGMIKAEICEVDSGLERKQEDVQLEYDLKDERVRLQTFRGWPHEFIAVERFAAAGFYFLHYRDVVKCPWCGIEGHNWEPLDDPMEEHRKWSPSCAFVLKRTAVRSVTRSRPTSIEVTSPSPVEAEMSPAPPAGRDVCGNYDCFPNSVPEDKTSACWLIQHGMAMAPTPSSHPKYSTYQSRMESFKTWPKSLKQRPDVLSACGFFYEGGSDLTVCYHCDGELKNWEENDDPWEQHAAWYPDCQYLLLKKGKDYVDEVQFDRSTAVFTEKDKSVECKEQEKCLSDEVGERRGTPLCKVCYTNDVEVLFVPCSHIACCVDCSFSMNKTCPLCRKPFDAIIRAVVP